MKKLIPLAGIAASLLGLHLYLLYSVGGKITVVAALKAAPLLLGLAVAGESLLVWSFYYYILSRLPWRLYPGLRFASSWLLLWALGIAASYVFSLSLHELIAKTGVYGTESNSIFVLTGAIVSLFLSLLFTLSDFSWFAYYRYASETLARMRAQRRQKELQFDVLRAQLTPHYLFNSLNTASNLISYDLAGAEQYLRKLAHNINYLMAQQEDVLNTLARELEIVDSFFHLMQVRYGDRIKLHKEVDRECLQQKLPTLALQLLLENAIKHNVASTETPVLIMLSVNSKGVVVENNITRAPSDTKSGKVGLRNLQERYEHLSGKVPRIEQSSDTFSVHLPYITSLRKEAYV